MPDPSETTFAERLAAALGLPECPDVEPAHEMVEDTVAIRPDAARGQVEVLYVARDHFPPRRYWPADGSRGRLVSLRGKDRADVEAEHPVAFPVAVGQEGCSLRGAGEDGTHLYVPPQEQVDALGHGRETLEAVAAKAARQLGAYDAWRRGEVYGVVREIFVMDGDGVELLDVEPWWLRLDLEGALQALREIGAEPAPEPGAGPRP